jgi:chromosome partitioning protein
MRTIAVVNQKGGSGKTTTAVNIAAALAERGEHVLLVDLDAQGSASAWLGTCRLDDRLLDVFIADAMLTDLARDTAWPRLSLVAASANLRDVAVAHAVDVHHALRRALPPPGRFDRVVLDCPPALGHVVIAALAAADMALVPVAAHAMELDGLAAAHRTITTVRQRINPDLALRVLACRVDHRTRLAGEVVATLRERLGAAVLTEVIRENVRVAEAPSHGLPVLGYAPRSAGAQDYRAAAAELG